MMKPSTALLVVFLLSLVFLLLFRVSQQKTAVPCYKQMVKASNQMQIALQDIKKYRQVLNISVDSFTDPQQTGWIGEEITPLTTTLGNLEAKQTALNPDFAALFVRWLMDLEFKSGETIALQLSGSFPALNIAAIIACEILDLHPIISSSIGSSSYGANLPDFSYLDIEKRLFDRGIIQHRSILVTPGGNNDSKILLWENTDSLINGIIERTGYPLYSPLSLHEAIQNKWRLFHSEENVKGFINIGGNQSAIGNCEHSTRLPVGLVRGAKTCKDSKRGLLMYFLENKEPVIHILDVRSLAIRSKLPLIPNPIPSPGNSAIYYQINQPLWTKIVLVFLVLSSWKLLWTPYRISRSSRTTSTRVK